MRNTTAAIALTLCLIPAVHAATVPAGFTETTLATGLTNATAMAIAPDGRIFVCMQSGAIRVIKNDALLPTPFVTLTVNSPTPSERGLLGVTFDPDFLTNQFVYVYYTALTPAIHNRISRLTASGDVAAPGSELVLLELNNLSAATNHNGGAIHFGRDGKLYAGVGENAIPSNAQTLTNLLGKMLRINNDGTIPLDNPFYGTASGDNRAIWARGLRNPFTFAFHPNSGRMFINDVGQSTWEEINDGVAGANYGWSSASQEGPTTVPGHTSPIHYYANDATTCSIAGGVFYAPEVRQYPATYVESYFFSDLCGGWTRRIEPATPVNSIGFATNISQPLDLLTAHDGSIVYLTHLGAVVRVRWSQHLEGDVNGDGVTNNADAFYLINYLQAGGPAPVQGGDVDNNGSINAADLDYLIAYLLGRGPTPV